MRLADSYGGPRVPAPLVGEVAWTPARRHARYVRPDELHQAFSFGFLNRAVGRRRLRHGHRRAMLARRQPGVRCR